MVCLGDCGRVDFVLWPDLQSCDNWRGFSLLGVVEKVFARVILQVGVAP